MSEIVEVIQLPILTLCSSCGASPGSNLVVGWKVEVAFRLDVLCNCRDGLEARQIFLCKGIWPCELLSGTSECVTGICLKLREVTKALVIKFEVLVEELTKVEIRHSRLFSSEELLP